MGITRIEETSVTCLRTEPFGAATVYQGRRLINVFSGRLTNLVPRAFSLAWKRPWEWGWSVTGFHRRLYEPNFITRKTFRQRMVESTSKSGNLFGAWPWNTRLRTPPGNTANIRDTRPVSSRTNGFGKEGEHWVWTITQSFPRLYLGPTTQDYNLRGLPLCRVPDQKLS